MRRSPFTLIALLAPTLTVCALLAGSATAATATSPPGWVIKRASFTAQPGLYDSGGTVTCPSGTVAWGGGAFIFNPGDTLNTSAALGGQIGWEARVNDIFPISMSAEVDAVCAKKPSLYKTVSTLVDNPAQTQAHGTATCPTGTVLLGGTVASQGDTTSVYIEEAWPSGTRAFTAYQGNADTADEPFVVGALCGQKPPGYVRVHTTVTAAANLTAFPVAHCPKGTSVLSGGVQSGAPIAVNISSSIDATSGRAWSVDAQAGSSATTVTAWAICAS